MASVKKSVQSKAPAVTKVEEVSGDKKARVAARKPAKAVETPVVETPAVQETPVEVVEETPGGTRVRREVNAESVETAFNDFCTFLESEIARLRESADARAPAGGVKVLRSALKRARQLQADVRRVARKKRVPREGSNNSGFMKQSVISDAMADFLGVAHGSQMSRVECTKKLHAYIIKNNLQNPENRREILADKNLTKLLKYNKASTEAGGHGPLYYYIMQKLIQQHFLTEKSQ